MHDLLFSYATILFLYVLRLFTCLMIFKGVLEHRRCLKGFLGWFGVDLTEYQPVSSHSDPEYIDLYSLHNIISCLVLFFYMFVLFSGLPGRLLDLKSTVSLSGRSRSFVVVLNVLLVGHKHKFGKL